MKVGIQILKLRSGVEGSEFERVMIEDVFPAASRTPSVNRGGVSAIRSQHLLRSEEEEGKYWWLVKDSEALSSRSTQEIIQSMYAEVRDKVDALATLESSVAFDVTSSYDLGELDSIGRPIGLPRVGSEL